MILDLSLVRAQQVVVAAEDRRALTSRVRRSELEWQTRVLASVIAAAYGEEAQRSVASISMDPGEADQPSAQPTAPATASSPAGSYEKLSSLFGGSL